MKSHHHLKCDKWQIFHSDVQEDDFIIVKPYVGAVASAIFIYRLLLLQMLEAYGLFIFFSLIFASSSYRSAHGER